MQRMVSTRGVKFKFSEGEKVLCYEPDPTKAKVLYDSKVLEIKAKDQRGRKAVEYLIHFQGWNSSWDRCVCEDYVLKDTEENRQLQRDLAERAQLQLGAYLYRRERKKCGRKLSEKVDDSLEDKNSPEDEILEGDGSGTSGDESSCNLSQQDGIENCEEEEEEEEEEAMAALGYEDLDDGDDLDDDDDKVPLQLSDALKRLLEHDHDLINKRNKLVILPAEPNVVTILEGYLKHIAVNQLCGCSSEKPQCRYRSQQNIKALNIDKIRKTLIVCMEVLDGVRTYFDVTLGTLLLYNNEMQQYHMVQNSSTIKREQPEDYGEESMGNHAIKRELEEENSHVMPEIEPPFTPNTYDTHNGEMDAGRKRLRSYRSNVTETAAHHGTNGFAKDLISRDEDSEDNFPLAQIKQELPGNNIHSSVASTSSRCSSPNGHGSVAASHGATVANQVSKCDKLLNSILAWHLVPDSIYHDKPVYPSLVYGATHLARLFVKLPDLLSSTNMSEKRLKIVLHHLDNFLSYLEDHSEWFGESFYKENLAT